MSINRSRRVTFEENAEIYDQVSPEYPQTLVDPSVIAIRIDPASKDTS